MFNPAKAWPHPIAAFLLALMTFLPLNAGDPPLTRPGYYRFPAIHGDAIVFTAEGDLWTVSAKGGAARRLTSNPGQEFGATISPDGKTVAFSAQYEGPLEVYTMPVDGGLPQRRTWDGSAVPAGWTPDGRVLSSTYRYSTLPNRQLVAIDAHGGTRNRASRARRTSKLYARRARLFFSRACNGRAAPPSATRAARPKTSGVSTDQFRSGAAHRRLRRHLAQSHVLEWSRLLPLGPRRRDERVLDGPARPGREAGKPSALFDVQSASLSEGRSRLPCGADLWLLDLQQRPG